MKIGFLYYDFYPVMGGASVHGFYLAKELSQLGHTLFKINGEEDPYTTKYSNRLIGFLKILRECDLIYLRIDYFLKLRNLALLFAILFRKKVIVELNSPSDEMLLFGKKRSYLKKADKILSILLKRADAVIVVSKAIERYCKESLLLNSEKVHVVENGGVVFDEENNADFGPVSNEVVIQIKAIQSRFKKIAVWAGSTNKMQNFGVIERISDGKANDTAIVVIANEEKGQPIELKADNIFLFRNVSRADVIHIIQSSDVGLAFYENYDWCRWGFYNSSLKTYEFLNNGLLTISNKNGTEIQRKYPNFKTVSEIDEIFEILNSELPEIKKKFKVRTWKDVGIEVNMIITNLFED